MNRDAIPKIIDKFRKEALDIATAVSFQRRANSEEVVDELGYLIVCSTQCVKGMECGEPEQIRNELCKMRSSANLVYAIKHLNISKNLYLLLEEILGLLYVIDFLLNCEERTIEVGDSNAILKVFMCIMHQVSVAGYSPQQNIDKAEASAMQVLEDIDKYLRGLGRDSVLNH